MSGQEYTLVGVLVAAVAALFTVNKMLLAAVTQAKDSEISDLRARLDRSEALIYRLVGTTKTAVEAAEKVVGT